MSMEKLRDPGIAGSFYGSFSLLVLLFCLSVFSVLSVVNRYCFVIRKRNIPFSISFGKPAKEFPPLCGLALPLASLVSLEKPLSHIFYRLVCTPHILSLSFCRSFPLLFWTCLPPASRSANLAVPLCLQGGPESGPWGRRPTDSLPSHCGSGPGLCLSLHGTFSEELAFLLSLKPIV